MPENLLTFRDQVMLFLPGLVGAILIFILFWLLSNLVRRLMNAALRAAKLPKTVCKLLGDIVKASILIFGIITAFGTVGINIAAMVAGLGLTGFALGFALQDIVANTLAGILILTYRPFEVGDKIKVAGNEGQVLEIDLRYTTLRAEGMRVLVPNSKMFNEVLTVIDGETGDATVKTITTGDPA